MRNLLFVCVALIGQFPAGIRADSYPAYPDQRIVDHTGRFYVLVERKGGPVYEDHWGPVKLTFANRRPGSVAVNPAKAIVDSDGGKFTMTKTKDIVVRVGDDITGRVDLKHPPSQIVISSTGLGVAT